MESGSETSATHATAEDASALDPRFAEYQATGDRAVRNDLVEDHRWLALHCARRFDHKGEPSDDLEQVATVGLLKAVDRFDPDLGYRFTTFAVPTILGELRRYFRDRGWAIRVPRRAKDNYLAVKTVVDELHQVFGRSPSIPEIAQRAGLDTNDTIEALEVGSAYRGVPLDESGDAGPGGATVADGRSHRNDEDRRLGVDDPGYGHAEARMTVPGLLGALPSERERQIVKLRFVDDMSQSRIAARLGLSQVHVSRLLRNSLRLMRRRMGEA